MGIVKTFDFRAKSKPADISDAPTLGDLYYGPFNHEDFLSLRRIQSIAQRDTIDECPAQPPLYSGYTFDQHMNLTLATNHLGLHLKRVTDTEKSEYPAPSEFTDLRTALGKLRSYIHIQHVLVLDCDSTTLGNTIERIKSHRDFYISAIDLIRKLEDKIDTYTQPQLASVTRISPNPDHSGPT